jgi:hypothetical protein
VADRLFVLVVTDDAQLELQALCALRAAGCTPMLGHVGEDCPTALRRTWPDVVLLDTTHPCATSERFHEEAAEIGARVVAFAAGADLPPSTLDARALA